MRKTLVALLLAGTIGCSTIDKLDFHTMTQDMRGANKVRGNCVRKAGYLFESLKSEGKTTEILVVDLGGDRYHAIVRYIDEKNRWIYLDPTTGGRDIFCKGKHISTPFSYSSNSRLDPAGCN